MGLKPQLIVVIFLFSLPFVFSANCTIPCTGSTTCRVVACDTNEGICKTSVPNPLPSGCCLTDANCNTNDFCTTGVCDKDTNKCQIIATCTSPNKTPTPKPCQFKSDCNDDNDCTTDVCVNNLCVNTVIQPLPERCCLSGSDCPIFPCTVANCNFFNHQCHYNARPDCVLSSTVTEIDNEPSPTPTATPSSEGDDSTDTGDIAGAIAGFVILITLIIIFILIVGIICVKNIYQKIRGDS